MIAAQATNIESGLWEEEQEQLGLFNEMAKHTVSKVS